jgi:uncharacterized protein YjbJ (UPF0337 family)
VLVDGPAVADVGWTPPSRVLGVGERFVARRSGDDEEPGMSTQKKAKNSAAKSKGKAKVLVGRLTGNKSLRAKGKREQAKATVKQAGQKIKDAAKR